MELLKFIVTTIYFSVRGTINQQTFGTAMGSPVSHIITNRFMEFLEEQPILTSPITCKSKQWKRYVDDEMEVVRCEQELTEHLNSIDTTGSSKFIYNDGTVKLLVYRKKTHTDQYLNFMYQHPLHQKLGSPKH